MNDSRHPAGRGGSTAFARLGSSPRRCSETSFHSSGAEAVEPLGQAQWRRKRAARTDAAPLGKTAHTRSVGRVTAAGHVPRPGFVRRMSTIPHFAREFRPHAPDGSPPKRCGHNASRFPRAWHSRNAPRSSTSGGTVANWWKPSASRQAARGVVYAGAPAQDGSDGRPAA